MKSLLTVLFLMFTVLIYGQITENFNQDSVVYLTDSQEAFMVDKDSHSDGMIPHILESLSK